MSRRIHHGPDGSWENGACSSTEHSPGSKIAQPWTRTHQADWNVNRDDGFSSRIGEKRIERRVQVTGYRVPWLVGPDDIPPASTSVHACDHTRSSTIREATTAR